MLTVSMESIDNIFILTFTTTGAPGEKIVRLLKMKNLTTHHIIQ